MEKEKVISFVLAVPVIVFIVWTMGFSIHHEFTKESPPDQEARPCKERFIHTIDGDVVEYEEYDRNCY